MIPLSCLAAILIMTGYKLAKPSLFRRFYKLGWSQFIPFFITLLAVVFTDLLKGVGIGMVIGVFYILRNNMRNPYFFQLEKGVDGENVHTLRLAEEVSFLNKGAIQYALTHLPAGVKLIVDGSRSRYIDYDVMEVLHNFKANAYTKKIEVEFRDIKDSYTVPKLKHMLE
jgi:MFS superfamily sulfate permease-like transporter